MGNHLNQSITHQQHPQTTQPDSPKSCGLLGQVSIKAPRPDFCYLQKKDGDSIQEEKSSDNSDVGTNMENVKHFTEMLQSYGEEDEELEEVKAQNCLRFHTIQYQLKWNQFMKVRNLNFLNSYKQIQLLGKGSFGEVYLVKHKSLNIFYAAKKISKIFYSQKNKKQLFSEMTILNQLDHPNIIKLIEVYDYMQRYVLIFEYLESGKDLETYVREKGNRLEEKEVIGIMKQVFRALIYLKSKKIVHRDVKCQNLIYCEKKKIVKMIDFGISAFYFGSPFKKCLGTTRYNAPEVINQCYELPADVWSCGVMLYRLLSGTYPFRKSEKFTVEKSICNEPLSFNSAIWQKISPQCKDLLCRMLEKNPYKRIRIQKCFTHPWTRSIYGERNLIFEELVVRRLVQFNFLNSLEALVSTYIITHLVDNNEKDLLSQVFMLFDKDCDGLLGKKQMERIMRKFFCDYEKKTAQIFRMLDLNKSGSISFTEFLVGTINYHEYINEQNLENAFNFFDMNQSGGLTFEELAIFLQGQGESRLQIIKMFNIVDENKDGLISKKEFTKLLMKIKDQSCLNQKSNLSVIEEECERFDYTSLELKMVLNQR